MTSWALGLGARLCLRTVLPGYRRYAAKTSRTPLRVLSPEDVNERARLRRVRPSPQTAQSTDKSRFSAPKAEGVEEVEEEEEEDEPILEGNPNRLPPGFPPYDKKGMDDTILCRYALDTSSDNKRRKSRLIMLEGSRLIQEALAASITLKALFFSRVEDVVNLPLPPKKGFIFEKVVYKKIQRWSKLTTSPGIIGFFEMPNTGKSLQSSLPISIICDNVRDPSNLGSVLRIAASAGCRSVYLTKGCADLWNDKVIRSGMGAHFHLCVKEKVDWSDLEAQLEPNAYLIFADNRETYLPSPETNDRACVNESDEVPYLENKSVAEESRSKLLSKLQECPVFPYYLVNYSAMDNMYLIIGGETGISSNAVNLGTKQKKFRVNIPMMNNVESLNVSSALAILAFEIKRQFEISVKSQDLIKTEDTVNM